jgi:hypothetical protein
MATAFIFEQPNPAEFDSSTTRTGLRNAPRYSFLAKCEVEFEGLGRATLPARNISASGLCVAVSVLPEEGTRVRCAIPLPTGKYWVVGGYIARVIDAASATCGIAIAFEGVSAHDRTQLAVAFA